MQALRFAGMLGRALIILFVSGLLGAMLVRMAPGVDVDEQELDPRLRSETIESLRRRHAADANVAWFYPRFVAGLLHGDAGQSRLFGEPVSQLVRERIGTTIHSVAGGLAVGWCAAVLLATLCLRNGRAVMVLPVTVVSGTLLSVPSAVLAAVCLWFELPPAAAIAAVVFPRVFPHVHQQLCASLDKPHVVIAQARGLSWARVFFWHIVPTTLLPILALAGVSVTLALGASIPVEALADSPGLGNLAWRAALGRDIPVLVTITLLLTAVTIAANLMSEIISVRLRARAL